MKLACRAQRFVVLGAVALFALALLVVPDPGRKETVAAAAMPACPTSPTALGGLVNGNTLRLGNGTTVTPCIANAPIHMRIGYSDGGTGGSVAGTTTQFTTDGITFPDGRYTRDNTSCIAWIPGSTTIAMPTILKFADGTQSAGPSNVGVYGNWPCGGTVTNLYAKNGWSTTAGAMNDAAMLVHMRLKNLQINRNAYMTVTPQGDPANPTAAGTGDYKLTFTPNNQGAAGWNIGDSCVYTDLWLRADTHIKVNIFSINTSVGSLAGDSSLWGSILSSIASGDDIPGLELDAWVYYMNTNKGTDCSGAPTTLNMPSTNIRVSP